jgi:hypothetical protein
MNNIINWCNANQGALALVALFFSVPTLAVFAFKAYRQILPARIDIEALAKGHFTHAEVLKREVESKVEWDDRFSYYGEFLIRDMARKLPETDEAHSAVITPHSIATLTKIHSDYLEFTTGTFSLCSIKKIGDGWYFCDDTEDDSVRVQAVMRLPYRDIVMIRWETNDYWEWPQVCCRFTRSNKFPFSHIYYAREAVLGSRKTLLDVCPVRDVRKKNWA